MENKVEWCLVCIMAVLSLTLFIQSSANTQTPALQSQHDIRFQ